MHRPKGWTRCISFLLELPQAHPVPADTLSFRPPRLCFCLFSHLSSGQVSNCFLAIFCLKEKGLHPTVS